MHSAFHQMRWIEQEEDPGRGRSSLLTLPKNLRLHHENIANPWKKSSFEQDFILITEFAESEGPRAVMTIPSGGGGSFDKNAFALHIMSVDFQSQNKNADFTINEDTQLVLTEKTSGICAFVHHFTLHDIHARGYVRPFCMSYIGHSKRKILSSLDNIRKEFEKIAKLFHFGNRVVFSSDLEQRLRDLLTLNEELRIRTKSKPNDLVDRKKEYYEETWKDTKKVIDALQSHMLDPRIFEKFKKIEALAERRERSFTLDSRFQDSENSFAELERSNLKRVRSLSSLEELKAESGENIHLKTFAPAYLRNLHPLRHLHELSEWGAKEAISKLRNLASYFSREDITIAVEKNESTLVDPSPSLLTLGRSVVLNFMHNIDLRKCISTKNCDKPCANQIFLAALHRRISLGSAASTDSFKSCLEDDNISSERSSDSVLSRFAPSVSFHFELHNEEYDTCDSDTTPETPCSDISAIRFDGSAYDNLSLSEFDIIGKDSVLKRQLSVMEIRNDSEVRVGLCTRKSRSLENLPSISKKLIEQKLGENEIKTRPHRPERQLHLRQTSILASDVHPSDDSMSTKIPVSIFEGDVEHENRAERKKFNFPKVFNRKLKHEHENSGKQSPKRTLHHPRSEKLPLRCYAEEVYNSCDVTPVVSGILEFRNHYSFGVHLVYALLSGRPVIIMGEAQHEREVRFLVSSLWTFVLDHNTCGRTVIPWRKKSLHITDIPSLRLAGLCKSRRCVLSKSVKRYVSILDYETGTIISPPYKGIFLSSAFNYRNCWPSNTTFLAFIHSVFLELACKAYVYYYACCIGTDNFACSGVISQEYGAKSTMEDIEVLTRLGVHFSDASIVQYFAEVIKQQQIDAFFHGNEELRAQTVIADLSKCLRYKNVAPLDPS